jgi:hypothetical protein
VNYPWEPTRFQKVCNSIASLARHHTARAAGSIYAEKATICRGFEPDTGKIHDFDALDRIRASWPIAAAHSVITLFGKSLRVFVAPR